MGVGDPAVAQLLEEYVVGWAAGSIPRYRQAPHPPGTLPGLSRWCRTLRHDIMKDLCQPSALKAALGAPGQSSDPEAQGASRSKAATPKPRRRKMKNSAFRRAERERMVFDGGESWREAQRRKDATRKKWAKVMDEAPLLSFLARLAAEGKLGDADAPLRKGVAARLQAQAERRALGRARPPSRRHELFWSAHALRAAAREARSRELRAAWARYQFKLRKQRERREARA